MADVSAILTAFRLELIDAELVRRPSEAAPAGAPPMVVEPIEGPPAPGELAAEDVADTGLVLSLLHSGDLAEGGYDAAAQRRAVLDVHYRARSSADLRAGEALDAAIRAHLIRPETNYGYGFMVGGLYVQQVAVWAGFGPISRSRSTGYHHKAGFAVIVDP